MVELDFFQKIARNELDVIEFGEVKNMHFGQNGGWNVESGTNLRHILEESRIDEFFVLFENELIFYFSAFDYLCPNSHFHATLFFTFLFWIGSREPKFLVGG